MPPMGQRGLDDDDIWDIWWYLKSGEIQKRKPLKLDVRKLNFEYKYVIRCHCCLVKWSLNRKLPCRLLHYHSASFQWRYLPPYEAFFQPFPQMTVSQLQQQWRCRTLCLIQFFIVIYNIDDLELGRASSIVATNARIHTKRDESCKAWENNLECNKDVCKHQAEPHCIRNEPRSKSWDRINFEKLARHSYGTVGRPKPAETNFFVAR